MATCIAVILLLLAHAIKVVSHFIQLYVLWCVAGNVSCTCFFSFSVLVGRIGLNSDACPKKASC